MSLALTSILDLMRQEDDYAQRLRLLRRLRADYETEVAREVRHVAYGLRCQGWSTDQARALLGVSKRTFLRYVKDHRRLTGLPAPPVSRRPPLPEIEHFIVHAPIHREM